MVMQIQILMPCSGEYFAIWCWSAAEVSAGAVCSCLPSVRRLVVRVRATGKAGSASNYENSVPIPMGRMRIENTGSGCVPLSDELAGDKVASDRGSDNESEIKLISAKNLA